MEALLQEMRDMETLVPRQAPPVASLATSGGSGAARARVTCHVSGADDTWAAEYLDTEQNVIDWSREFLAEHTASLGGPDPVVGVAAGTARARGAELWAAEYLDSVPSLAQVSCGWWKLVTLILTSDWPGPGQPPAGPAGVPGVRGQCGPGAGPGPACPGW